MLATKNKVGFTGSVSVFYVAVVQYFFRRGDNHGNINIEFFIENIRQYQNGKYKKKS
jgi:hypothetical protein